ncbi:hypothetical protein ACJIZ3_008921 [Penstemon smallii]|uniref:Uncharacterized protein n=1 Tax=Penstemon smallii TaxID=265156 RepID=A0ABD3TB54_9LAMI
MSQNPECYLQNQQLSLSTLSTALYSLDLIFTKRSLADIALLLASSMCAQLYIMAIIIVLSPLRRMSMLINHFCIDSAALEIWSALSTLSTFDRQGIIYSDIFPCHGGSLLSYMYSARPLKGLSDSFHPFFFYFKLRGIATTFTLSHFLSPLVNLRFKGLSNNFHPFFLFRSKGHSSDSNLLVIHLFHVRFCCLNLQLSLIPLTVFMINLHFPQ